MCMRRESRKGTKHGNIKPSPRRIPLISRTKGTKHTQKIAGDQMNTRSTHRHNTPTKPHRIKVLEGFLRIVEAPPHGEAEKVVKKI